MRRVSLVLLIAVYGVFFNASAQQENTLYFMQNIPQSVSVNPALAPKYKFSIGLPGISSTAISFANTGFHYKDIFNKQEGGSKWINLNDFYDRLSEKNFTRVSASSDLFSLGFKAGARMHFTFNVTEKVNARLMMPKGLFWAIQGNAPEVAGSTIQMSPRFDAMHYREFALGSSYVIDDKLTVGVRGKLLFGKANIHTEQSDWSLTTQSENYQLSLQGNANIQTSGLAFFEEEGVDEYDYIMNKNNKGFALDLGATYKVMDRLTLGFSVIDLGAINWKDKVKNYELPPGQAYYNFNGIDIKNEDEFDAVGDTIETRFKFNESTDAYRTGLPTKFYLSGNYYLLRNTYLGVVLFGEISQKTFSPSLSASIGKDFGRTLSLSVSYTAANRSANQIGAGFAIKLLPMQIYFVSDNIIGAAINPTATKAFNARLGVNFVFGRVATQDKQSYK